MRYVYCTLFDINYTVKGIAMLLSLRECSPEARIYVLALDDKTAECIGKYDISGICLIKYEDFIHHLKIRNNMTYTEFCWSCSANLLQYVFDYYQEEYCTYIDADMIFYSNPSCLIDEMIKKNKSVQIIEHRFTMDQYGKDCMKKFGRFCVEFNTFHNDEEGMKVLKDWINQVDYCCSETAMNNVFGDQKYLDKWIEKFECVSICENELAGIAPWNIDQYRLVKMEQNIPVIKRKKSGTMGKIIFYHFHGIEEVEDGKVNIAVYRIHWKVDGKLVEWVYKTYIERLKIIQITLEKQLKGKLCLFKKGSEKGKDVFKTQILKRMSGLYWKNIFWNIEMRFKSLKAKDKDIFRV